MSGNAESAAKSAHVAAQTQLADDTGHVALPPNRVAADITGCFDRYLGPARK